MYACIHASVCNASVCNSVCMIYVYNSVCMIYVYIYVCMYVRITCMHVCMYTRSRICAINGCRIRYIIRYMRVCILHSTIYVRTFRGPKKAFEVKKGRAFPPEKKHKKTKKTFGMLHEMPSPSTRLSASTSAKSAT